MANQDIIAWLIPTTRNSPADKATAMPSNADYTISTTSSPYLTSRLSNSTATTPQRAIQLSFSQTPKQPGCIIIGTDPASCDVLLPALPGISPQHCAFGFDGESRLVLDDFSEKGTQVWYDWESNGDQRDYSWLLSGGYSQAFPSTVQKIVIDIQGVRFQVIVNDHSDDWVAYQAKVDAFCDQPSWTECLSTTACGGPTTAVLCSETPQYFHVIVKGLDGAPSGEVYLWNTARPWEPMIKAAA